MSNYRSNIGKKRADLSKKFDRQHLDSPAEAADLVKSLSTAKFDETVELATRLGVDPRRAGLGLGCGTPDGRPNRGGSGERGSGLENFSAALFSADHGIFLPLIWSS